MKTQKCSICESEWNSSVKSTNCPFCGNVLFDESKKFTEISEVFTFIIDFYGVDIIKDKRTFVSLLGDYAPSLENERKLVKIALESGVYKTIIDANDKDESEREICVDRMIAKLQDQFFLSPEWSQKVVSWLIGYLKWDVSFVENCFSPISVENIGHSISNTGFDAIVYDRFNRDPDYISAQKNVRSENYNIAFNLYETAYKKGNVLAGVKLALLYSDGLGVEQSKEKAYQLFLIAQNYGDPLAKAWISEYYRMGYAVPQDKAKAKEILENCLSDLEQMCACGDAEAQYYLGYEYLYGLSLEKDQYKAVSLLKKAYADGVISAGVALADCHFNGWGCAIDKNWAVALLEACAKSSNKKAHFELGKLYYYGDHVTKNYSRAFSLFLFAAERGHKTSQDYVGDCYYYGRGVKDDYVKAFEWYTKAYNNGDAHAASQLGRMYYSGRGVEVDKDKSFYYFNYAAERNNVFSQYFLMYFYFPEGKYQDYKKGLEYLHKAAEANDTDAQVSLAKMYCHGDYGLKASEEKCYEWFLRAAELGNPEAERVVGEMYTHNFYVDQDPYKSRDWIEKAIGHGDKQAYISMAELYMNGSLGGVDAKKVEEYLDACRQILDKDPSELSSGSIYKDLAARYYNYGKDLSGSTEKRFVFKATSISELLYKNGHEDCLYTYALGVFIENAFVDREDFNPYELLNTIKTRAAQNAKLAALLAKLYENGCCSKNALGFESSPIYEPTSWHIKPDLAEYEKWIKIAIDQGDMDSACKYAIKLCNQLKRPKEAFKYAQLAHERGNYQGTFLVGCCYKYAIGVKKNKSLAKELLSIAKEHGYSE